MVIVYKSNTGFTKAYAEMLARAEKLKLYDLERAQADLDQGAEVFYMGPLMAGHICGIDQAVKRFEVKGACGVGMTAPGAPALSGLEKANYVPNAPVFYLQGGYAPRKLSWLKRRMVNMATKAAREELQAKGSSCSPREQAQLDMYLKGGSFVAFEHLEEVRAWIKGRRT